MTTGKRLLGLAAILTLFSSQSLAIGLNPKAQALPASTEVTLHPNKPEVYDDPIPFLIIKAACHIKSPGNYSAKIQMLNGKGVINGTTVSAGQTYHAYGSHGDRYSVKVYPNAKARISNLAGEDVTIYCKLG